METPAPPPAVDISTGIAIPPIVPVEREQPSPAADPISRRLPFFYGWVMVPIVIAAQVASWPGQTPGVSIFNPSFREALGLNHTELTGVYMIGTVFAAFPQPYFGAMMDRHGVRRTLSVVVLLFGLACFGTSQVTGLVSLFLAFFFLRMLGQGALSLGAQNTLPMWFHKRLGTASGRCSFGCTLVSSVIPAGLLWLIHAYGWRWAYAILGLLVWSLMLPILALFYRNRPEDVGQRLDGEASTAPSLGATIAPGVLPAPSVPQDFNVREALRTRAFWILLAANTSWSMIGTAILFNFLPLLEDHGLTATHATATLMTLSIAMAVTLLFGGFLADRLGLHYLIAIGAFGMAVSIAILILARSPFGAHLWGGVFGSAQGLFLVAFQAVWARYFGRAHLGKIRGIAWTATVSGSGIGPFLLGVCYDFSGTYTPMLIGFAAVFASVAVATLFAPRPTRPESRPSPS